MGHGPHLLTSTLWRLSAEKWRLCSHTDTSCGRLVRCGFGRRWEETAQRGHNYSAAASTATTSSFSKEESLTKQLAQAITNNFSPTCTLDADTLHQLSLSENCNKQSAIIMMCSSCQGNHTLKCSGNFKRGTPLVPKQICLNFYTWIKRR